MTSIEIQQRIWKLLQCLSIVHINVFKITYNSCDENRKLNEKSKPQISRFFIYRAKSRTKPTWLMIQWDPNEVFRKPTIHTFYQGTSLSVIDLWLLPDSRFYVTNNIFHFSTTMLRHSLRPPPEIQSQLFLSRTIHCHSKRLSTQCFPKREPWPTRGTTKLHLGGGCRTLGP